MIICPNQEKFCKTHVLDAFRISVHARFAKRETAASSGIYCLEPGGGFARLHARALGASISQSAKSGFRVNGAREFAEHEHRQHTIP